MEPCTARDSAEMERAASDAAETTPDTGGTERHTGTPPEAGTLLHVLTPPEPEWEILDMIDDGIESAEELIFGRW